MNIKVKYSPYDHLELTFYSDDSVKTIPGWHITNSSVVIDTVQDEVRIHHNLGDYYAFPLSDKRNKKSVEQLRDFWEHRMIYAKVVKLKPRGQKHGHRKETD